MTEFAKVGTQQIGNKSKLGFRTEQRLQKMAAFAMIMMYARAVLLYISTRKGAC